MTTYVYSKQSTPAPNQAAVVEPRPDINHWTMESSFVILVPCCNLGRVKRENGMIEACSRCLHHEASWFEYHAEQRRLWLKKVR